MLFDIEPEEPRKSLLDWQNNIIPDKRIHNDNPCVVTYGFGPEKATCKTCKHLLRFHQATSWMKCKEFPKGLKRKGSQYGPDHKANWQACNHYEENNSEM